jgi:hypothetical protein
MAAYLPLGGGTMTGPLTLAGNPATGLQAATKQYVDAGDPGLSNPVTIAQGGTGQTGQQAAINALTGTQSSGTYLRSNGTNSALTAILAADLPTGTTSAKGALQLDGTASDIQPTGPRAAGSTGLAADAGHVHFSSGMFLCTPTSYAPGTLSTLTAAGTTFAALSSANVNTGSFAAPASGNVLVTASFVLNQQTATTVCGFALAAHATVTPLVSNIVAGTPANTSAYAPTVLQFLVTGLASGTSYTFDLLAATTSASDAINIPAQTLTSTTLASVKAAPVVMTVQAV